jgi:hypothetical protein
MEAAPMSEHVRRGPDSLVPGRLHAGFLSILPRIECHGHVYFRFLKCPDRREDAVAEMVALAWLWFLRLAARGRDATRFGSALATFAARAVRAGRKLGGKDRAGDVLSPAAQVRHGFAVGSLPTYSSLSGNPLEEALTDNAKSPIPEQVHFRVDWPCWLATRTDRDRRIVTDLMVGERTSTVAARHGLTSGRVSQLRTEFHQDWLAFLGEDGPADRPRVGLA